MSTLSAAEAQAAWREGARAFREGDAAGARDRFRRIVDSGRGDASVWLGLALAARRLGDPAETLRAVDEALEREPGNLRALMLKGDHLGETGDPVAAAAFYGAVVQLGGEGPS
ncbi:MAG: tetratricopeptide repeat protein, partial [Caulobacteraceae bacterium]|nr:tetratricopeptide repeat protein [Caulobacter sp.]